MSDIGLVIPEASLTTLACLVLMVDVFRGGRTWLITFWAGVLSVLLVLLTITVWFPIQSSTAFYQTVQIDVMSAVLKAFVLVMVMMSFFYAKEYFEQQARAIPEFFVLALFATLGMMVLISAGSLVTVYLGLELLSLSLYAMVAMDRDSVKASEAAMKYFILGALASGMLLYGMSMIYGVTGTLDLALIAEQSTADEKTLLLVFGLAFMLTGIAFKLGVAPFHMWVPDVYQGASTPVTLFISSAPKLAAFALAMRVLTEGLSGLVVDWQQMLMILAVLSMAIGNIVAIAQTNIKRMLAYSTVAHMGFLLLGLIAANALGYAGAMFYAIVYSLTSMGAFGAVIVLSRKGQDGEQLSDFAGLSKRSPWIAFLILVLMFSLAGVPPFAGFWAKWFVLKELVGAGYVWLAAVAVFFSIIGAFYYLRVVKLMYFDEPMRHDGLAASSDMRLVFSVNSLAIVALGILPGSLMSVCEKALLAF
ncbi:MAG: NADH-quinone oxidoreductase subunit NuoN [Pseudomonadota bacterium]